MAVPPCRNSMFPVGVPVPGATTATVAVKVTGWPTTDGLTEEATAVVVAALLTTWEVAVEVEVA